ncbi:hypothetical protein Acr_04g0000740 [Actinidia rufa]|uniref:Uncharacterized protein n=1 Tax=Actinidia rufa TaxID=165716 RepID=A0A7J0EGL7_9ERIC|nr:hypothetical protein Acr_04g0000740 [Actinidia rufa]
MNNPPNRLFGIRRWSQIWSSPGFVLPAMLLLPSLARIFVSLISSPIAFEILPQTELGRTGDTPVRGHAVLRVVVNDRCALVSAETLCLGPELKLVLFDSLIGSDNGERWIETARFGDEFQSSDSIAPSLSLFEVHTDSGETTVRRLAAAQKFSDIKDIIEYQKKYPDITNEDFAVRLICLYGRASAGIGPGPWLGIHVNSVYNLGEVKKLELIKKMNSLRANVKLNKNKVIVEF